MAHFYLCDATASNSVDFGRDVVIAAVEKLLIYWDLDNCADVQVRNVEYLLKKYE